VCWDELAGFEVGSSVESVRQSMQVNVGHVHLLTDSIPGSVIDSLLLLFHVLGGTPDFDGGCLPTWLKYPGVC
jgi:hypothetical protein